jgi:hypothetical protein
MSRALRILCSLAAATAVSLAGAVPAVAGGHRSGGSVGDPAQIATGLVGPLQLDVGRHGDVVVGQSFAALLSIVHPDGTVDTLTQDPVGVDGVAAGRGSIAYTTRSGLDSGPLVAEVKLWHADGTTETIADIAAWEAANNVDAGNQYGFQGLDDECLAQVPPDFQPYSGAIDAHPYALLRTRGGWFVADAGVNAILKVTDDGDVSPVYVFKPQNAVVSADVAAAFGLPDCVAGATFAFEPVPTDVEYDRHGGLVASLLPGGPEDASLGARGSVVRIKLHGHHDRRGTRHGLGWGHGHARTVASGFLGATNVAVGPRGRIYVSELFGNQISVIGRGGATPLVSVPSPAGLEYHRGSLIASTDVFGAGNIVSIRL